MNLTLIIWKTQSRKLKALKKQLKKVNKQLILNNYKKMIANTEFD